MTKETIKIELNGFKIDSKLSELTLEKELALMHFNTLLNENKDFGLVCSYINVINEINTKLIKWIELKQMYELNIKIHIFDKKGITLIELQNQLELYKKITEPLKQQLNFISLGQNKIYELSKLYSEFIKYNRLLNHCDEAIKIAKAQKIFYEIDSFYIKE